LIRHSRPLSDPTRRGILERLGRSDACITDLASEWDGMPGHVVVNHVTLEDLGDGRTKVVTTSLFHTTEERDGMLHSGMEGGLNESYAALDTVLATRN